MDPDNIDDTKIMEACEELATLARLLYGRKFLIACRSPWTTMSNNQNAETETPLEPEAFMYKCWHGVDR